MIYTNEQLNSLAAGVLDVECWHEIEPKSDNWLQTACIHCGEWIGHDEPVNPDYCNDRDHAVRVAKAVDPKRLRVRLIEAWVYCGQGVSLEVFLALMPAKTLLLAAFVAAGKITMDEAKEAM